MGNDADAGAPRGEFSLCVAQHCVAQHNAVRLNSGPAGLLSIDAAWPTLPRCLNPWNVLLHPGPRHPPMPDECKIYVGNLPTAYDTNMLRALFEPVAEAAGSKWVPAPPACCCSLRHSSDCSALLFALAAAAPACTVAAP